MNVPITVMRTTSTPRVSNISCCCCTFCLIKKYPSHYLSKYFFSMPPKRKAVDVVSSNNAAAAGALHFLTCKEGTSDKFYEITVVGTKVISTYGRTGTQGASVSKELSNAEEVNAYVDNLLVEKKKKGYVDETPAAGQPVVPTEQLDNTKPETKPAKKVKKVAEVEDVVKEVNYLECTEGGSRKFYELTLSGDLVTIRYGKIGTNGVVSEKAFDGDVDAAAKFAAKTVAEKEKKGYVHVAGADDSDTFEQTSVPAPVTAAAKKAPAKKQDEPVVSVSNTLVTKTSASAVSGSSTKDVKYLECTEGSSRKFYEITVQGDQVTLRYGRIGTDGIASTKEFNGDTGAAARFAMKTVAEKEKKGYTYAVSSADTDEADTSANSATVASSGNLSDDLENGLKVFIKGSSAMPYTLKKFNGGYSCSCPGWAIQVHIKGVQATSCKHLKLVRGEETEAERCQSFAGAKNTSSAHKDTSIPGKISLAQQWSASTDPSGYIMSEKLDGMRAYWNGKKLWTRSGLPIIAPEWFLSALPSDLHLDGELFLGRQMFDECMSIARRTDASEEWKQLKYVVFDAPTIKGGIMNRLESAQKAFEAVNAATSVYWTIHPQQVCRDMEHLLDELALIEAHGGEGLMLRSASVGHRGGRSSDLLKVKSFHDDEALVTAYEDGKGKYQGLVGSLVCITKTGARFKCGSGLSDSMRTKRGAPAIGSVITFKYFELTKDGIPRFPTFLRVRPDVGREVFPEV